MKKFLILSLTAAALVLFAASPADAAARKVHGVTAIQSEQLDLSARRYRRHVYRYHRHRYYARPYYYHRYGYYRPRYYPYAYYGPRYYYPYAYGYYPYYYRRPGFFIGFAF